MGKGRGDYDYQIDWDDERRAYFVKTCAEEMNAWAYEVDFDSRRGR